MTNLKRIIDEKGVQQRWLAEQVGVTEVSMSRYVNGARIPKAPMAIRMADVLGVDVKELYGWDDAHVIGENEAQPETHEERTETHACDLISRQAVIEINRSYHGQMPNEVNHRIWKEINELPSAQPERKKGKWIPETEDWRNQIVWVKCSECGFDTSTSYNYCPNCGCRMDGGEQDE